MKKLALSDDILMKIERPARYIGGEVNSVTKNKEEVDMRIAFCFPDVYEIGMSHLGIQILYDMFNSSNCFTYLLKADAGKPHLTIFSLSIVNFSPKMLDIFVASSSRKI